jgi:hypothetical protein
LTLFTLLNGKLAWVDERRGREAHAGLQCEA